MDKLSPLISELKDRYKFIPLENLSSSELKDILQISKVYIDFGRLPGKDRIPREAILNDCCIIIGKRGAGLNNQDFPIPEKFKIRLNKPDYIMITKKILIDTIENYYQTLNEFNSYKEQIINEKKNFEKNIKNFINSEIISKR